MKVFLFWLTGHLPCRIISDANAPYLERYYLWTLFGMRAYLHRFVGSDPDRGLHNHPWRWAFSFILSGWYYEQTHYGTARVRWFNGLVGDSFHRVILPTDHGIHEVWTLFVHRAKDAKPWGFLHNKGQLGIVFEPYRYSRKKDTQWWKTAPVGRLAQRQNRRTS